MTGLEPAGIPGPEDLRNTLTNCTDPIQAIQDWQINNGVQVIIVFYFVNFFYISKFLIYNIFIVCLNPFYFSCVHII